MEKTKANPEIYESYPLRTVLLIEFIFITVYAAGAYVMFTLSIITGIIYLLYILLLEFSIYRECPNCCYYGVLCAFGRGKIASKLFKKGNPKGFEREITFKDFLPQLLLIIIPIVVGIALQISRGFNLVLLIITLYPLANWFLLNPITFGKFACPHCKQGIICCPALKFFGKKRKEK